MGAVRKVLAVVAAVVSIAVLYAPHAFAATGTISGVAFQDTNRNGVQDAGEAPFSGHVLYLYDGSMSNYLGSATTDSAGHYAFGGLVDGPYVVQYEGSTWESLKASWTPTTTGSLFAKISVSVAGSAVANFGWRQIVRSTTLGSPITSYSAPSGLKVESYDDVVSAQSIYTDLMTGSLVGPEAAYETIRFDVGTTCVTATSVTQSGTTYSGYSAVSTVAWGNWLTSGDTALFHEYGHAWSLYYDYIVQQESTFSGYLQARGLSSDTRVGSSYMWDPKEMIAEDYRQLFGSATAQTAQQMNYLIPPASQVAGLKTYLSGAFKQSPSGSSSTSSGSTTLPAFTVSNLGVNPAPVSKSGTVSFQLSLPANATVKILDAGGSVVRTLLNGASEPSGSTSTTWDRKNSTGSRVKSGTYTASVSATDSYGRTQTAAVTFSVS